MAYLGFDTSNYTTSAAVYYPESGRVEGERLLLPVREGEKGLMRCSTTQAACRRFFPL